LCVSVKEEEVKVDLFVAILNRRVGQVNEGEESAGVVAYLS